MVCSLELEENTWLTCLDDALRELAITTVTTVASVETITVHIQAYRTKRYSC